MKRNDKSGFVNLYDFLKKTKIHLTIRRSIHRTSEYSCEILNGWIKSNSFYLNVYGVGNTENEAINDLIKQISGKTLIMNIDNNEKKKIVKVPLIYFLKG